MFLSLLLLLSICPFSVEFSTITYLIICPCIICQLSLPDAEHECTFCSHFLILLKTFLQLTCSVHVILKILLQNHIYATSNLRFIQYSLPYSRINVIQQQEWLGLSIIWFIPCLLFIKFYCSFLNAKMSTFSEIHIYLDKGQTQVNPTVDDNQDFKLSCTSLFSPFTCIFKSFPYPL